MSSGPRSLEVTRLGERTVIGFGDRDAPDEIRLQRCRDELEQLLRDQPCAALAFDLSNLVVLPSTILGLLLSLRQRGLVVQLLNPSDEVRAILQITRLGSRFELEPADNSSPA